MRIKSHPFKLLFFLLYSLYLIYSILSRTKENFCHESILQYKFLFEQQITSERVKKKNDIHLCNIQAYDSVNSSHY